MAIIHHTREDLVLVGPRLELRLWVPRYTAVELIHQAKPLPAPLQVVGVIDTGAVCTVIPDSIAQSLGLPRIGTINMWTAMSTSMAMPKYHIRLLLPNDTEVEGEAAGSTWPGPGNSKSVVSCFIGRDILQQGILIYHGLNNSVSLIF